MSKKKLTPQQFAELSSVLHKRLTEELVKEIEECALPELGKDISSDLWSTPKVDSKTVVKLSPTVKELVGWRLDPTWIQKGGYATVAQAVSHVVGQIAKYCVATPTPAQETAPKQPEPAHV